MPTLLNLNKMNSSLCQSSRSFKRKAPALDGNFPQLSFWIRPIAKASGYVLHAHHKGKAIASLLVRPNLTLQLAIAWANQVER